MRVYNDGHDVGADANAGNARHEEPDYDQVYVPIEC